MSRVRGAQIGVQDEASGAFAGGAKRFKHMFNPWLTSSHRLLEVIADNVSGNWHMIEPRKQRRLRDADRRNRDEVIRAILVNLAFVAAMGIDPPVAGISLREAKKKRSRYERKGFTALPRIVSRLSEASPELLVLRKSRRYGQASAIECPPAFKADIDRFKVSSWQFTELEGRESIYLSRTERDFAGNVERRELVDYEDTPETVAFRSEVSRLNTALNKADLALQDESGLPTPTGIRSLRRVFNLPPDASEGEARFDLGGRLFGGWWQQVTKERRTGIRIDGEPIADLDYQNLFLRLAYVEAGLPPPYGDLYAITPELSDARHRPGVKKAASAMLFRRTPLLRAPRGSRGDLPAGISGAQLRAAILAAHPGLAGVFETGIGLRLMFLESQILVRALLSLTDDGIVALPMHDGLMAARSKEQRAIRAMTEAAVAITGQELPVISKRYCD